MSVKYYKCNVCGQIVSKVDDKKTPLVCCGQFMEELIPDTVDAVYEKHVPVYEVEDGKVTVWVGLIPHPMREEHYIQWITLETEKGRQHKKLKPGDDPKVCFKICKGDKVIGVYAYCNLHALWKSENAEEM